MPPYSCSTDSRRVFGRRGAIVRYAKKSTRPEPIDDITYCDLARHFRTQQIIDICLTVGLSNVINRFHATFQTDVDKSTLKDVADGNAVAGS